MERSKLQQRNYTLDLKARLGKTQVVTNTTPINQQVRLTTPFEIHYKHAIPLGRTPGNTQVVTGTAHTNVSLELSIHKFCDLFCRGHLLPAGPLLVQKLQLHPAAILLPFTYIRQRWQEVSSCLQAGYFCNVCDCILRDSASYLDHINGKYHNRALGMSMRVEKSTVDDVRTRLEKLKEGREQAPEMDSVADGV